MSDKTPSPFVSLFGASQLSVASFIVSGIRNVWLAASIGLEGLGANSLSSLLISLYLFSDFGAALYLRKGASAQEPLLGVTTLSLALKKVSMVSSFASSIISLGIGFFFLYFQNSYLGIAFIAAAIIYPIQCAFTFRITLYSVMGNQIRGAAGMFFASLLNLVVSVLLFSTAGIWIIAIGPAFGFAAMLLADSLFGSKAKMALAQVLKANLRQVSQAIKIESIKLSASQFLALIMSSSETAIVILLLGLGVAGELSFATNLLIVLTIFPIAFSNTLNNRINTQSTQSMHKTLHMLAAGRKLFLEFSLISTIVGVVCYQFAVIQFLPVFSGTIDWIWPIAIATYLYNSTFYTSTLTIAMNAQSKVMGAQLIAIATQVVTVAFMYVHDSLSMFTIVMSTLIKAATYFVLHTLTIWRLSKGELPSLRRAVLPLIPKVGLLLVCATLQTSSDVVYLYAISFLGVIIYSFKLSKSWILYRDSFKD